MVVECRAPSPGRRASRVSAQGASAQKVALRSWSRKAARKGSKTDAGTANPKKKRTRFVPGSSYGGGAPGHIFCSLADLWHSSFRRSWADLNDLPPAGDLQVFVNTLAGKTVTLDVGASDTTEVVKAKVEGKLGVSA